jgi:hypothetical protein
MSQPTIRTEIRLQLLRAADRMRSASQDIDLAIDALDRGDFWDGHGADARINADIASSQIQTARGMAQVASLVSGRPLR